MTLNKKESLSGNVIDVYPSKEKNYWLIDYSDTKDELRHLGKDNIITLPGNIDEVNLSPNKNYIAIKYEDEADSKLSCKNSQLEIRHTVTGEIVFLACNAEIKKFSPNETYAVINFLNDAKSQLIRLDTRESRTLSDKVSLVYFSPKDSYGIIDYIDARESFDELRRSEPCQVWIPSTETIETIPCSYSTTDEVATELHNFNTNSFKQLPGTIFAPQFSSNESYLAFWYRSNGTTGDLKSQIRQLKTGNTIIPSSDNIEDVYFSPNNTYYIIDYEKDFGLIHYVENDLSISLSGEIYEIEKGQRGQKQPYWLINYNDYIHVNEHTRVNYDDLLDVATGKIINLPREVKKVYPSHNNSYWIIDYFQNSDQDNYPSQLLNTKTGELTKLPEDMALFSYKEIYFSPDESYFIVDYGTHSELYNIKTNETKTISLSNSVKDITFSSDGSYFLVTYKSEESDRTIKIELWGGQNTSRLLTELDPNLVEHYFDLSNQRLVIRYNNNKAYLIDLDWLETIAIKEELKGEELIEIACQPFAQELFDKTKPQPRACK